MFDGKEARERKTKILVERVQTYEQQNEKYLQLLPDIVFSTLKRERQRPPSQVAKGIM